MSLPERGSRHHYMRCRIEAAMAGGVIEQAAGWNPCRVAAYVLAAMAGGKITHFGPSSEVRPQLPPGTSTDQVAGFGSSAKRRIGRSVMAGQITRMWEKPHAKTN